MSARAVPRPALLLAVLPFALTHVVSSGAAHHSSPARAGTAAVVAAPALTHTPMLPAATRVAPRLPSQHATRFPAAKAPYRPFSRRGPARPWWNRPSGIAGSRWVYPYFPTACFQADAAAHGRSASAWQVLWAVPDRRRNRLRWNLRTIRRAVRGAQSIYAASAERYLRSQHDLFTRSLAPRFVTTSRCQPDVRAVRVPTAVYHRGVTWSDKRSGTPLGVGTLTDWLLAHGYAAPNRKYLVILQNSPSYPHLWAGISENLAAQRGTAGEIPTLDNPANYTSYSYIDSFWVLTAGGPTADVAYPAQVMAHEMAHALGAMTDSAPHGNVLNPLHPTDCWDVLCSPSPTPGQTYRNGCGPADGWGAQRGRGAFRLDCNRDDYWTTATDAGRAAAAWASRRWAVSSSSFLYGNPQPTSVQLAAHRR